MKVDAKKRSKRGHGEASYRLRTDGRWEVRFTLPGGKAKSMYGRTRAEVQQKHRAALRDLELGADLAAKKPTTGDFLQRWLAEVVKPTKAAKTYATYADIVRLHIVPGIGKVRIDRLEPAHVASLLREKSESGLSATTVHHIRAVLRAALAKALKWGVVTRNVAALVESPRQVRAEVDPLSVEEARELLSETKHHQLGAAFRIALTLGLRQGEILGLRWSDIDLATGKLRVRQALQRVDGKLILKEPKTEKSRRVLRMPNSVTLALEAHRGFQDLQRVAAGDRWVDTGLVFTTSKGTPHDPRNVLRHWHAALLRAGLPRRPFHASRHTAASLLIAEGVPLKVVQEMLGHSLLSTTADIYGHLTERAFDEAAAAMDRMFA